MLFTSHHFVSSSSGLSLAHQPTWTAAFLPFGLCHHRVAVHAAEPVAVGRRMRYSKAIEEYCSSHGVRIPGGFHRHPASRYAVVLGGESPQLVATTWFKQEDVIYYMKHSDRSVSKILDFKEKVELQFSGSRLTRGGPFS